MPRSQLPPSLPPETRPVGQVIAEALRLYADSFWRVLPIGLPVALTNQVTAGRAFWVQVVALAAATPLLTAAYVAACLIVVKERPSGRVLAIAFAAGVLVVLPVPLLVLVYILPAVAWLAFVGLVVPVVVVERLPLRAALVRAVQLARADYVHALGSLAAATIVFGVTKIMLILLLRGSADAAERIALFLADLVLSPLLFLVPALLYFDQAARVVESAPRSRRRRHGDIHPALEPDGARRADTEVES
ncbi:MAG: hypothetical protein E6G32_14890 [Actinobacteria bacterium]|nr:MAG: hypothetical protein E6G32_14890 [Actinomycetota bacterium]